MEPFEQLRLGRSAPAHTESDAETKLLEEKLSEQMGQITALQKEIGVVMWERFCAGGRMDAEVEALCRRIALCEVVIGELSAEIRRAKEAGQARESATHCQNCGRPLQRGTHFCPDCGRKTGESPGVAPETASGRCPACGRKTLEPGRSFCPDCGAKLG